MKNEFLNKIKTIKNSSINHCDDVQYDNWVNKNYKFLWISSSIFASAAVYVSFINKIYVYTYCLKQQHGYEHWKLITKISSNFCNFCVSNFLVVISQPVRIWTLKTHELYERLTFPHVALIHAHGKLCIFRIPNDF